MLAPHPEVERRLFSELLPKTSYVGEIGLDFGKDGSATRQAKVDSFTFVLKQVQNTGKVLSIHSRKAENEIIDLLDQYKVRAATFHWFTGNNVELGRLLKFGHYLSINPAMLRSNKGRLTIAQIPRERVLFETDGPYCKVAKGPAGPWDINGVAQEIAILWGCSVEGVQEQVNHNFRQMLLERQQ